MRLTVTTLSDEIFNLEVSDDMEVENVKALCEFECGIPSNEIQLLWNGRPLADVKKKLSAYGVSNGDILLLQRIQGAMGQGHVGAPQAANPSATGLPQIDFGAIQMPGAAGPSAPAAAASSRPGGGVPDDPASVRELLLNSPHDLALLKERNPPLAEALLSGDLEKFSTVLRKQQQERAEKERQRIQLLNADQFDPSVQQQIQEEIRLKNVESNMEAAMEHAPESFGQVIMLYIDCKVNGHPVKAFVDSGAQMTIMSQRCAERCGIMRLVDTRWAGIAKGVGTQRIIGRVHLCPIQIQGDFLQTSFSILEEQPMDMLLGLDMLKRHQCLLDLRTNKLVIGTTGTETTFLNEGDLPEHARLNRPAGDAGHEAMEADDRQLAEALARSASEASASGAGPSASTSSTSNTSNTSAQSTSSGSTPSFPEVDIQKLTSQGFSRQQAVDELKKANGNVDQALVQLLAKSFQIP